MHILFCRKPFQTRHWWTMSFYQYYFKFSNPCHSQTRNGGKLLHGYLCFIMHNTFPLFLVPKLPGRPISAGAQELSPYKADFLVSSSERNQLILSAAWPLSRFLHIRWSFLQRVFLKIRYKHLNVSVTPRQGAKSCKRTEVLLYSRATLIRYYYFVLIYSEIFSQRQAIVFNNYFLKSNIFSPFTNILWIISFTVYLTI